MAAPGLVTLTTCEPRDSLKEMTFSIQHHGHHHHHAQSVLAAVSGAAK
jgi:hypothetical protein